VDFQDPRKIVFNFTTGVSDGEDGGRYDNMIEDWLAGRYRSTSMEEAEYREGMMGELVLLP
jgi:hypothetical protein